MAKIIEFYVPSRFRKSGKWIPCEDRGKLLEFPVETKKSAWRWPVHSMQNLACVDRGPQVSPLIRDLGFERQMDEAGRRRQSHPPLESNKSSWLLPARRILFGDGHERCHVTPPTQM